MVQGFLKSEEGIREYKKIGLSYPDHLQDELYEDWMKQTQGYSEDVAQYYGRFKEKEVCVQRLGLRLQWVTNVVVAAVAYKINSKIAYVIS